MFAVILGLRTYASKACTAIIRTASFSAIGRPPAWMPKSSIGIELRKVPRTGINPHKNTTVESNAMFGTLKNQSPKAVRIVLQTAIIACARSAFPRISAKEIKSPDAA